MTTLRRILHKRRLCGHKPYLKTRNKQFVDDGHIPSSETVKVKFCTRAALSRLDHYVMSFT